MSRSYRNRDRRIVNVTSTETRIVRRLRRRAEQAVVKGYRAGKKAQRATKRGWWYA